ncbi:MAG TPA: response regulator [Vicinamibacterales bacterium]|nr:response regulator [Vicinamibacterales bacterium]
MSVQAVHLVDDDASVGDALRIFLELNGVHTRVFSSGEAFLEALVPDWTGCVLLDVKMPGMNGLEVQEELRRRNSSLPVVMMTAHGDVATVRTALKAGAHDFLEKPVDNDVLLDVVRSLFDLETLSRKASEESTRIRERLGRLTMRERQVMAQLAQGRQHRDIAELLSISPRTVEVYKARMMEKLGAKSLAEIIHMAAHLEGGEPR